MANSKIESKKSTKLISKSTKVINTSGLEVVINYKNGTSVIHLKYYVVNNRLYTVQVVSSPKKDNNKDMVRFFESFHILKSTSNK